MTNTDEIHRRIEAAQNELAAAQAELARPLYDPGALYYIYNHRANVHYLVRGLRSKDSSFGTAVAATSYTALDNGSARTHQARGLWVEADCTITKVDV